MQERRSPCQHRSSSSLVVVVVRIDAEEGGGVLAEVGESRGRAGDGYRVCPGRGWVMQGDPDLVLVVVVIGHRLEFYW